MPNPKSSPPARPQPMGDKLLNCGQCPKQTNCCRRAPKIAVLPKEKHDIVMGTGRFDAFVWEKDYGIYSINKGDDNVCPFLDENSLCSIYNMRPIDCRMWPITKHQENGSFLVDKDCPCINDMNKSAIIASSAAAISQIPTTATRQFFRLSATGMNLKDIPIAETRETRRGSK